MEKEFTICVADRNPRVREFLKREMMASGYRVRLAENGREAVRWCYHPEPIDLLILDPDFPDMEGSALMKKIRSRIPALPVILHTYPCDYENFASLFSEAIFVEKQGNSVERLKQLVSDLLFTMKPD